MPATFLVRNVSKDPFSRTLRADARPVIKILNLPHLRVLPGHTIELPFFYVEAYGSQIAEAVRAGTVDVREPGTNLPIDMDAFVRDSAERARVGAPIPVVEKGTAPAPTDPPVDPPEASVEEPPAEVDPPQEELKEEAQEGEPEPQEELSTEAEEAAEETEDLSQAKESIEHLMSLKRSKLEALLVARGLVGAKPAESKLTLAERILAG